MTRTKHPTTLDFDLNIDNIPEDFIKDDIRVDRTRNHIIFVIENQIQLISKTKTWYIDGTFKLIKDTFKQLVSFQAFIRSNQEIKQDPLLYTLMSGRKKKITLLFSPPSLTSSRHHPECQGLPIWLAMKSSQMLRFKVVCFIRPRPSTEKYRS